MSEQDVVLLLRDLFKEIKKDFPEALVCLSANEISNQLKDKANKKNIERAISQLQKYKEIESIHIEVETARKIYGKNLKKGLKLFFVVE
jgi:hypothetical protein